MCEQIRFSTFSLLIKNGDRPPLVLKPRRQAIIKSTRTVIMTAATVAHKLCSSPANLPNIQGKVSFRLTSLQHLHAPLLFIRGAIIQVFFIFFLFVICIIRIVTCILTLISVKTEDVPVVRVVASSAPSSFALLPMGSIRG